MKRVTHSVKARDNVLHVEADGCIVNIRVGLTDQEGRRVTSVEVIADHSSHGGDSEGRSWTLADYPNTETINVRVVREKEDADE